MFERKLNPVTGALIVTAVVAAVLMMMVWATGIRHGTMPTGPPVGNGCQGCLEQEWLAEHGPPKAPAMIAHSKTNSAHSG